MHTAESALIVLWSIMVLCFTAILFVADFVLSLITNPVKASFFLAIIIFSKIILDEKILPFFSFLF